MIILFFRLIDKYLILSLWALNFFFLLWRKWQILHTWRVRMEEIMEIYFYSFYRTDEYFSAHKKAWNELFLKIRRKFSISRKAFQYLFIYQIVVCLFNSLVFSISRFYVNYYSWGDLVLLGLILFHFSTFFFLSTFLDGVGTIILDWVFDADFWATQS